MNFVFDLYGTLIDIKTDEQSPKFWQKVAAYLGANETSDAVRWEYLSLCSNEKKGENHEIDLIRVFQQMLLSRGRENDEAQRFATYFRRQSMKKLRTFRYAKKLLKGLKKRGGGVYLVSNAQSCFTLKELDDCGLTALFDGILISSDVGVKKPSSEIFQCAFDKFDISPENSIYVGNDLRDDILGAAGVGMRTVYIPTEQSGSYKDMPEPTYSVKNHRDLMQTLFSIAEKR